ncbi:MAG: tRNA (adenosine(37)-N6)-threonylcarbamoyltransferase complex ATPase subunit type 1 TsaE [Flavobacteriales bacterium]|nr:tRNA (adenosine(37)-N6)-threonylcarbamoyltransferase complex ATPase subunit type 1 TsaE [Flavobacteriales bacterium]MBP9081354.1 tRNA (adenosine(37)-N6)-threonylcarbamoyltransferase complex ATPase subunit type 1 TsaE [Flavobacteriales bacterium]
MSPRLVLHRAEDAPAAAAELLHAFPRGRVFTFNGPLGAGKTTLIKALCAHLGVEAGMASPSFSIVNEYRTRTGEVVYHFDLYRLNQAEELEGIGFTEYLDSGRYCFVEWPHLGAGLYPPGTVDVVMDLDAEGTRTLRTNELIPR